MKHLSVKRMCRIAALPVALSVLAVRPVSPVTSVRPFLGHRARATKKTAKFAKILDVHLIDGFQDGHFDLTAAGDFFVATTDGAAGGLAGRTHLRAYKLKAVKGSPKHVQQLQVPVSDEVGTLRIVNTTKPELLLVPTTADPLVVPAPPDPVNDPLDHYKCYRVAIAKKTAKLPKGLQATVTDPFTGTDETFAVKALKHLCLPVDEDGAGIRDASRELACYTVAAAKGQPKAVPQHALQLNNQLGPLTIDTAKESELCVPAERPAPTPTPRGSGGLATATRTATPVGAATPTPLSTTVPPDPSLVAPPVARGVVSIPALGTSFLYTGADPVQTGVAAGTIDARRAAVLRGRVLTTAGAPIAGVTIDIQGHPELGTTRTQLDGGFDLVANGGGPLTVRYRKDGLLAVTRELDVPWQQFVMVPDVVMMALDAAVTAVTFGPNAPFQTAASTTQNDGDGTRHTLLLFPAGTSALLVLADGSTQSAGTLHVRATEFTVGASGPAAMPAALPPLSGYTYCTELSADEAIAAGATTVAFDQPVIAYTENFLDFPVGAAVPLGFFDRRRAVWVAEPNGRIVKITAVNGGVAAVDTDGDGVADDGLALTLAERQSLGAAYPAGTSLWRMPTEHFSPHDGNNPFDTTGDTPPGENGAGPDADDTTQDSCQSGGSIIECENQVLGEKVAIVGTPYTLDYRSDRVPARSASKHIRLSGAAVPPTLASIDLHLAVAGRSFDQSFPASPNQETTFTWDRMDAYGRQLIGGQTLAVTIDYNYPAVYREPGPFPEAFNQTGGTTFGANPTRQQVNLSDHFTTTIGEGLTDARTIGLGGWSLGVHHVYDPVARVLYTGGGSRQRAGSLARLLATIDLPGKSVLFDVATGPDGSLYVALPHHDEIMRIAPDGTETVVAGTGTEGFSGDGGLATAAELGDPTGVAVAADGSLYIAEQGNRRVRRVGVDGIITTIAGSNTIGTSGDGGPATLASFTTAERIAVGADASLYVVDGGTRIRRITTDGIIRTVAGNGVVGFGGDGGPATSAKLNCASVSAAADGGFYIADIFNHRVRRVAPDGTIATIVDYTADQGTPASVRPAPDGGLVIAVSFTSARTPVVDLRKTDGTLLTIAGGGPTPVKDGVPATQANLAAILAVTLGPDGSVYLVRGGNDSHVVRVSAALPGFEGQQILIASPNGDELYVFDPDGRHRRTLHARTGAVLREFGYDASGRLASITEKTGGTDNVTTIEHDAAGNPSAIVGPFGQRTELTVDANGFLATIANPAAETQQLTSSADGLLLTLTSARGKTSTYTYDDDGRLLVDADPATGTQTLARTAGADAFTVTRTTTLGRVTSHTVATLAGDVQQRTVTDPAGVERTSRETIDAGTSHLKASDGTTFDGMLGPDPRFGMQASFAASERLHFPSGLESHVTRTRAVALANPGNPLSLQSLTDTNAESGKTSTTVYTAASRATVTTSPLGRQFTLGHDALGRITTITVPGVETSTTTYDARGRVASVVDGAGPGARTTTFAYDAAGFLHTLTDPLGRTATFAYDAAGRVTQKTLADARVVAYGYDADGNLTSVTPPGRPPTVLAYDDRNVLTSVTPPSVAGSGPTTYTRDADRALTSIARPGNQAVILAYDGGGRLASRTLKTGATTSAVTTFGYDPTSGALATITGSDGIVVASTYDGSLLASETWSGPVAGSVSRTYTSRLTPATETVAGTAAIPFAYDDDGLLIGAGALAITRDADNGVPTASALGIVAESRTRDVRGHVATVAVQANATPRYAVTYTRDAAGRVTQKAETVGGVATTLVYTYDGTGRVTDVTTNGAATEHYVYDTNGNRTGATVRGTTITASYDAQDRLLQYGSATFAYDGTGALAGTTVGPDTTTYDYDEDLRLQAVTLADGTDVTYLVDGLNRRIGKKVNGLLVQGFLYGSAFHPVAELDGAGAVVSRFVYADRDTPAYFIKGGALHRIVVDQVGSVRLVVNATTGAVEQRLDYDAFGNVLTDTNPGFQPFGFAGGLYDRDTGLVLLGLRDYDPATGRFTTQDPLGPAGLDPNLYRYVHGDPVNATDPNGLNAVQDFFNDAIDDPVDFYGGIQEGSMELAIIAGSFLTPVGPAPAVLFFEDHTILGTLEEATDSNLIDTQNRVFAFGRSIPLLLCPSAAPEAGAAAAAAEVETEAAEVTQIVRARKFYRPFARRPIDIISPEKVKENVGRLIDDLFDKFPEGGPKR